VEVNGVSSEPRGISEIVVTVGQTMEMGVAKRPVVRYHGGKWNLAPWIISHFPTHRIYVEPYCGGASVLMRKPRVYSECINDLNGEIVNLFQVLRDPVLATRLRSELYCTPFAHDEFREAYQPTEDDVERARRTIIKGFMGFGSAAITAASARSAGFRPGSNHYTTPTGFRANSNRSRTVPAHDWANYPDQIPMFVERLRGVVIENKDALRVMEQHDTDKTLHYVDPPYVPDTRDAGKDYSHEMTDDDHRTLAETLHGLKGMVVLSGYPSELYEELFADWHRVERPHLADGARKRTEVLWMNPAAEDRQTRTLF
jgi:DNA adenine methylase